MGRTSLPLVLTRGKERWCWIWICFGWIKGTQRSSESRRRSASRDPALVDQLVNADSEWRRCKYRDVGEARPYPQLHLSALLNFHPVKTLSQVAMAPKRSLSPSKNASGTLKVGLSLPPPPGCATSLLGGLSADRYFWSLGKERGAGASRAVKSSGCKGSQRKAWVGGLESSPFRTRASLVAFVFFSSLARS